MVPIPYPWSATFFPTHEKYLYGIPLDISIDLTAFAFLPREFATASLNQNSPFEFVG